MPDFLGNYSQDNLAGQNRTQTLQLGFVGVTTAAYDATDGYAWSRLQLVGSTWSLTAPVLTGDKAFHPLGDTTIPVGTRCWITPDKSRIGYVLSPIQAGGSTSCVGCGWFAGLLQSQCLEVFVDGVSTYVYLTSADRLTWASADLITICGFTYTVEVTKNAGGVPQVSLTGSGGSGGGDYEGQFSCCGCGYATWAFPLDELCPGEPYPGDSCTNVVNITVRESCCPIDGWEGEGWYCVVAVDGDCADAIALELLEEDKCDELEICSGPYATQAEAEAECGSGDPVTTTCCPDDPIPTLLNVTFGGSLAALGVVPFLWDGAGWTSAVGGPTSDCGTTGTIGLSCSGTTWTLLGPGPGTSFTDTATATCSPFSIAFSGTASGTCSGAFTATVTAP